MKCVWWTILLAVPCLGAAIQGPVRIETGLLEGTAGASPEIRLFKGIPYAAPPVGNLRWRAPQPAAPWQGVRKADQYGNSCMQSGNTFDESTAQVREGKSPYSPEYYAWKEPRTEDCLYLNVWTSAKTATEKQSVYVYLHGGGFQQGSGALPIYAGDGLAKQGVVVVTINYRLGVFGFMTHPELTAESGHQASGNYGLMDQIAALRWVQNNIAAFGGDPAKVTVAGQSAGAHSVNYLVSSPLAKGLFRQAISESGGMFAPSAAGVSDLSSGRTPYLKDAEQQGVTFAQSRKALSLAALRALPAEQLVGPGAPVRPVVDGYVLPSDVYSVFAAGKQNDVPMLIGWNSGDGTPFGSNSGLPEKAAGFKDAARQRFGTLADAFLEVFPVTADADAMKVRTSVARDTMFAWQSRTWARMAAKTGKSPYYAFYWDHMPPGRPHLKHFGAFHSSEIVYALNNLSTWDMPWAEVDRKLSHVMSSFWVNFVKTGNPNGKGLPAWPAYDPKNERSMHFSDSIVAIPMPLKSELDFFEAYFFRDRL